MTASPLSRRRSVRPGPTSSPSTSMPLYSPQCPSANAMRDEPASGRRPGRERRPRRSRRGGRQRAVAGCRQVDRDGWDAGELDENVALRPSGQGRRTALPGPASERADLEVDRSRVRRVQCRDRRIGRPWQSAVGQGHAGGRNGTDTDRSGCRRPAGSVGEAWPELDDAPGGDGDVVPPHPARMTASVAAAQRRRRRELDMAPRRRRPPIGSRLCRAIARSAMPRLRPVSRRAGRSGLRRRSWPGGEDA